MAAIRRRDVIGASQVERAGANAVWEPVATDARRFSGFSGIAPEELLEEAQAAALAWQGKRVLQVNATARGGGVAELLRSSTPLLQDLGIDAQWHILTPEPGFFRVTKKIHNALQGSEVGIEPHEWRLYEETNQALREAIDPRDWDLVMVHDPQPLMVRPPGPSKIPWVWRCHVDLSQPNMDCLHRLMEPLQGYDGAVFTLPEYVPEGLTPPWTAIAPAIDPLTEKNRPVSRGEARRVVESFGIDPDRPVVTQVSRFDRWKDPAGVVEAWKLARQKLPGLQLALVGQTADDDPEGREVLEEIQALTGGLSGIHIIADAADDHQVRALQTHSTVVLQKSLREGFGLTITEAMWAGTPVIGSRVGGIPSQIQDGETGFLVGSVRECAARIIDVASDPARARAMGAAARERVREHFLLPRLLRDELRFWRAVVERRPRSR